ncbi:cation:proton antiporter family protein [Alteromonas oceanisediminis]|uniref:cation:proton antiporter family protein n=1 Tax=Alteromonas oceanisediminis TaxID=2836180 RepID=UPI001BD9230D|nr:cation:proton antiporter family protein [Alteromonas oceanisediminis]MBT0586314.1 cation:proton antiporter [Alteromonas oceanisediminis]
MEYIFLLFAFILGLSVKLFGIPPLVGYLAAGFALHFAGFNTNPALQSIADLGITIMLFTIGLKLNIKDLAKREVWLGSVLHTGLWCALAGLCLTLLAALGLSAISALSVSTLALIVFALSFSSTVCVMKVLEENGESKTRHGKIAMGILVMQDIFAVIFLVIATGKLPEWWAIGLILLLPAMPLFSRIINSSGHGELLPLTGFIFALGGYQLFELVGIKGDLGALVMGLLLAQHSKAAEMAKSLLSFKDLFLIGFFLSIGLAALPDWEMFGLALVLSLLLPIKYILFFGVLSILRLRARTSFLTGLVMSNYSEFGLIVAALAVSLGMLSTDWLVIIAMAVSLSFVVTSITYRSAHTLYSRNNDLFRRWEKQQPLVEDQYPHMDSARFLVVGMGRVGLGAFNSLNKLADGAVWGMDADRVKIRRLQKEGHKVITGDGEDADLWESLDMSNVKLVMLALPSIEDSINIAKQLKHTRFHGKVAAIARYEDEVKILRDNGVDKVFNFFKEAGLGFAEESLAFVEDRDHYAEPAQPSN